MRFYRDVEMAMESIVQSALLPNRQSQLDCFGIGN